MRLHRCATFLFGIVLVSGAAINQLELLLDSKKLLGQETEFQTPFKDFPEPCNNPHHELNSHDPQRTLPCSQSSGLESDLPSETIYQVLEADPKFSLVLKAINYVDDLVVYLNDTSISITFFVPPNHALKPPNRSKEAEYHHADGGHKPIFSRTEPEVLIMPFSSYTDDLGEAISALEFLEAPMSYGKKDHEKRKRILKIIIRALLAYHILPGSNDIISLGKHSTFPTNLTIPGVQGEHPLRLRVEQNLLPPRTTLNLFTKIVRPNVQAINGVIHVVDHPLIPPPAVFQELYMAPRFFSTLTSALQRSGLTDDVDLRYVHGKKGKKGSFKGASAVTIFAPVNHAFEALPKKLQLFLFSPLGAKVLKKLLQYHIVPNLVLHSDYIYNSSSTDSISGPANSFEGSKHLVDTGNTDIYSPSQCCDATWFCAVEDGDAQRQIVERGSRPHYGWPICSPPSLRRGGDCEPQYWRVGDPLQPTRPGLLSTITLPPIGRPKPISSINVSVPTLLEEHALQVHITKTSFSLPAPGPRKGEKIVTRVSVNGLHVGLPDLVGLNGAIHVIGRLLDPRKSSSNILGYEPDVSQGWEDWEDWLPQWADMN